MGLRTASAASGISPYPSAIVATVAPVALTAKVFDMLLAVPKYGRVKTNRILNQCRISPSKTIGSGMGMLTCR